MDRVVVLDTETTGVSYRQGDRIIEIGAVEWLGGQATGRYLHCYLQPDRRVPWAAVRVHGITDAQLVGQPRFAEVAERLLAFVAGSEVVAHNAAFDRGFIDHELALMGHRQRLQDVCQVSCSLKWARARFPGQPNRLDDLLQRFSIVHERAQHGALKDAQLLAQVLPFLR